MEGYLFFYLWLPVHLNTVTKLHFTHPAVPKRQFSSSEKQQKFSRIFKNLQNGDFQQFSLMKIDLITSNFLKVVFHKFYLVHSWKPWPIHQLLFSYNICGLSVYRKTEHVTIQLNGIGRKLKTHLFQFGVNFLMHLLLVKS